MPPQTVEISSNSLPKWLTNDYLQDKFRKRYDLNLQIVDVQTQPASAKGSNYTSEMLRMKVLYRIGSSSKVSSENIIVKITVSGENVQSKVFNEYGFYKREMIMYEKILPRLQELLNNLGYKDQISPKVIHVDYDYNSIVFEDLKESGFTMAERLERLDMNHAVLALNKLAKLHATACTLNEMSPNLFAKDFDRGIFNRHTQGLKPMVLGILDALTRYVEEQPELSKQFYEKLLVLRSRVMEYCERVFDVNKAHFMTLIHGDFWHMNMMFKYSAEDSTKPIDVVPLDFQCPVWASPAVDLHYFFNTSLREDLRIHEQPKLIEYYYKILVNTLKELKFKGEIPSLFEFRMQVEARSFYAFFAAVIFQPIMICPETEDADFMSLISNDEKGIRFKNTLFKNEMVQENLRKLLPIFEEKGLLDDMDSFHL